MNFTNLSGTPNIVPSYWVTYATTLTLWWYVTSCLAVFGCVLNVLLFVTIFTKQRLRSGAGVLIIHLVVIEWAICAISYPISIAQTRGIENSDLYCNFAQTFVVVKTAVKNYTMLFLALNRFVALLAPQKYRVWAALPTSLTFIVLSWLIALAGVLPFAVGFGGHWSSGPPWGSCVFYDDGTAHFRNSAIVMIYAPTITTVGVYLSLCCKGYLGSVCANRVSGTQTRNTTALRKRLAWTKILVVVTLFHTLCIFVPSIFLLHRTLSIAWPPLALWARTIRLCSESMNPMIFFAMSTDYRKQLAHLLQTSLAGIRLRLTSSTSSDLRPPAAPLFKVEEAANPLGKIQGVRSSWRSSAYASS